MIPLIWFLLAIAVGMLASKRGRSGFGWFVLAVLLSPLLGFIFLLVTADLSTTAKTAIGTPTGATHVRCPACAEWVLPEATVCKHCGGALTPDTEFYMVRAKLAQADKKEGQVSWGIAIVGFVVIMAVIGMLTK